jgi:hypothetical protein
MEDGAPNAMSRLLDFVDRLEREKIWYRIEHIRDSIMIETAVPGERWEIEFFDDGHVEVERFRSNGKIGGDETLDELFRRYSD